MASGTGGGEVDVAHPCDAAGVDVGEVDARDQAVGDFVLERDAHVGRARQAEVRIDVVDRLADAVLRRLELIQLRGREDRQVREVGRREIDAERSERVVDGVGVAGRRHDHQAAEIGIAAVREDRLLEDRHVG